MVLKRQCRTDLSKDVARRNSSRSIHPIVCLLTIMACIGQRCCSSAVRTDGSPALLGRSRPAHPPQLHLFTLNRIRGFQTIRSKKAPIAASLPEGPEAPEPNIAFGNQFANQRSPSKPTRGEGPPPNSRRLQTTSPRKGSPSTGRSRPTTKPMSYADRSRPSKTSDRLLPKEFAAQGYASRSVYGPGGAKGPRSNLRVRPVKTEEEDSKEWKTQRDALRAKFPEGWESPKRLSPEALEGIRAMHAQYPDHFSTPILAQYFKVSPEAIRRILKSKWRPNADEDEERRKRWERRGEAVWTKWAAEGKHAPVKWRSKGIGMLYCGSRISLVLWLTSMQVLVHDVRLRTGNFKEH